MQSRAVQISKILFLVLAILCLYYILGCSGSVVRRNQRSSDLIARLKELLKDFNEAEFLPGRCDTATIAALIRQHAQEIRELTLSSPAATFNCHCSCNGSYTSYLLPVVALVAVGFYFMWRKVRLLSNLKIIYISAVELEIEVVCNNAINAFIIFLSIFSGWPFSDVMSMTKQLGNVREEIASTKTHLTENLEVLGEKVEEQHNLNRRNAENVSEVRLKCSQVRLAFGAILEKFYGMDEKLKLAESKQDMTISRILRLALWVAGLYKDQNRNISEEISAEQGTSSSLGLQSIGIEGNSSKTIIPRPVQIKITQDRDTTG